MFGVKSIIIFLFLITVSVIYSDTTLITESSISETTTREYVKPIYVYFVLAFSTKFGISNLNKVLNNSIDSFQNFFNDTFKLRIVVSTEIFSPFLTTFNETKDYFNHITMKETGIVLTLSDGYIYDDQYEMRNRLYLIAEQIPYDTATINLFTDYYSSEAKNFITFDTNDKYNAMAYIYDYQAYESFKTDMNQSCFMTADNYHTISPVSFKCPLMEISTISIPNTSVLFQNHSTFVSVSSSTQQPTPDGSNGNTKIVIIASSCSAAAILILFILGFFIYRRRSARMAKIKDIQIHHQKRNNNDKSDYWELTRDKLLIKNEQLGNGNRRQILAGILLGKPVPFQNNKIFKDENLENEDIAVKILCDNSDNFDKECFLNEIQLMKLISGHDNIINMIGCITLEKKICLILEFCPFRDLLQYIKSQKNDTSYFKEHFEHILKEFLIFAWQISQGMNFLASKGIIHKNLTAENILIDSNKNAKISGFGMCVYIDSLSKLPSENILDFERFSIKYLAIESLKDYEFSLQSDIWSFGMILYEMLSFGEIPFKNVEISKLLEHLEAGNRPEKPEFCSDEIYTIMIKCWNSDPTLRPSFNELITIFTVFLEHATEGYGYLALLKSDTKTRE